MTGIFTLLNETFREQKCYFANFGNFSFRLERRDFAAVKKFAKTVKFFADKCRLFIPFHLINHWTLVEVDFSKKKVIYMDPLNGKNDKCFDVIMDWLDYRSREMPWEDSSANLMGWSFEYIRNKPHQQNGNDCGMFTCLYALYRASDKEMDFTQENINDLRKKMALDLLNKKIDRV